MNKGFTTSTYYYCNLPRKEVWQAFRRNGCTAEQFAKFCLYMDRFVELKRNVTLSMDFDTNKITRVRG